MGSTDLTENPSSAPTRSASIRKRSGRRPISGEWEIRQKIIEADLLDCIVAMPPQLFLTTGIPVCLWFLSRDKTGKKLKPGGDRRGETLFIDARPLRRRRGSGRRRRTV